MIACPNCGANLRFDPAKQRMVCDFCGSDFDPVQFDVKADAEEQHIKEQDKDADTYDVTVYTCPQCGGELLSVDSNTAAAFCSFCGASTILNARIAKGRRPEFIIPFSKTKEDCKQAYFKLVNRSPFIPREYKSKECIDGFRGIYMPYWSYDVSQNGPVTLNGETTHRSGDYIITKHFRLSGSIDAAYEGISYDASSSFSDSISEALAPYDIHKRVPFEPSYMSGFYADIADVNKSVYSKKAAGFAYDRSLDRIKSETREFARYTIKEGSRPQGKDAPGSAFASRTEKSHSCMFPVWFMSYRNGDRVTYATVNGQTGKVAADLPIDIKKYLIFSGILAIIIFVILNSFLILTPKNVLIGAGALTVLVFIINWMQRMEIKKKVTGEDDIGLKYASNARAKKTGKGSKKKEALDIEVPEAAMSGGEGIILAAGCISVAITLLMLFLIKPVNDMPYYVMCVIDAVIFALSYKSTLRNYNLMATRRLPQFDRKGGDDRA
ncbi:MAG: hypothetical protein K6F34_09405 [Lachnospiraceae bacterium]|nr:hypothetical protein [Lachnospiraceae bacterium]